MQELTKFPRLVLNLKFSCLSLPSSWIRRVCITRSGFNLKQPKPTAHLRLPFEAAIPTFIQMTKWWLRGGRDRTPAARASLHFLLWALAPVTAPPISSLSLWLYCPPNKILKAKGRFWNLGWDVPWKWSRLLIFEYLPDLLRQRINDGKRDKCSLESWPINFLLSSQRASSRVSRHSHTHIIVCMPRLCYNALPSHLRGLKCVVLVQSWASVVVNLRVKMLVPAHRLPLKGQLSAHHGPAYQETLV